VRRPGYNRSQLRPRRLDRWASDLGRRPLLGNPPYLRAARTSHCGAVSAEKRDEKSPLHGSGVAPEHFTFLLDRQRKSPLSTASEADARTRTGDPFITS
jgi:hypothetical protein